MCVIIVSQNGNKLNNKKIETAWNRNSDGAGIALIKNKKVEIIKGIMKLNEFLEVYNKINVPHIVHFRMASAGVVNKNNTHPFVFRDKKAFLFHNGHINSGMNNKSDTAILASSLDLKNYKNILSLFSGQKFAVVHKNGKIELFGEFSKYDGVLVSNTYSFVGFDYYSYYKYNKYSHQNDFGFVMRDYGFNDEGFCRLCGLKKKLKDGLCISCYDGTI